MKDRTIVVTICPESIMRFTGIVVVVAATLLMTARVIQSKAQAANQVVPTCRAEVAEVSQRAGGLSCIDPVPDAVPLCDAMAEGILNSTVRVVISGSGPSITGHGTVVGGQYVITHNHIVPYEMDADSEMSRSAHISLALANGDFFLRNVPLSKIKVIVNEPGMLLLDFETVDGERFFDRLGIPSAPLTAWNARLLQPGSEVAQVNWDGETTYVNWVRILDIRDTGQAPAFEVGNYIEHGASGGGVFLDGNLVGTNWLQGEIYLKDTHELMRKYSVVAVNTAADLLAIAASSPGQ